MCLGTVDEKPCLNGQLHNWQFREREQLPSLPGKRNSFLVYYCTKCLTVIRKQETD